MVSLFLYSLDSFKAKRAKMVAGKFQDAIAAANTKANSVFPQKMKALNSFPDSFCSLLVGCC